MRDVLVCLLCEGHALLEGVPGLGKTLLLKTLSCRGRPRVQPDPVHARPHARRHRRHAGARERRRTAARDFRFRPGPVFASLVLADEVNRATPKTQSALLEAMQERMVTVAGATRPLPRPFLVMATQNPLEMEGTYPLPEAQLDRFLLKALVPFPSAEELVAVVGRTTGGAEADVSAVADAAELQAMIALTREVPVPSHLVEHAVDLVVATHPDQDTAPELVRRYVRFGASPRGAQALILAAKATALLDGRPSVAPTTSGRVAPGALRHRLVLGLRGDGRRVTADQLVAAVLDAVPAPKVALRGAP